MALGDDFEHPLTIDEEDKLADKGMLAVVCEIQKPHSNSHKLRLKSDYLQRDRNHPRRITSNFRV
ncbi:hypothetical protein [Roseibium salinum]|uniref:Uncharacterized protein n=1 Tax=Roseibium salinum TaxID=1604349 RepID=A0ABT3QV67_9HYPH|nr:hypothetical protein [Roseibium sp. DSM 29163]MCX2720825.1 hypothetical protein [Roseibium sp. DSM 29163]MDN3722744.1 hypothetical protein [Roseibium salinum]